MKLDDLREMSAPVELLDALNDSWLERYGEWLEAGVCHKIRGYDKWGDSSENRVEVERSPGDDTWEDFMTDYADQWEPTYQSGYGKAWKHNKWLYDDEVRDENWQWITSAAEEAGFDTDDSAVQDAINDWVSEAEYQSPDWKPLCEQHRRQEKVLRLDKLPPEGHNLRAGYINGEVPANVLADWLEDNVGLYRVFADDAQDVIDELRS